MQKLFCIFFCFNHKKTILKRMVFADSQGFEPQMTEPKSVVLPLHHESLFVLVVQIYSFFYDMQILFKLFSKFTVLL